MPAGVPKLLLDVIPGFFNRLRAGRVWPKIDEPLNMSQSFLAREFLPDLRLHRREFSAHEQTEDEQSNRVLEYWSSEFTRTLRRYSTPLTLLLRQPQSGDDAL